MIGVLKQSSIPEVLVSQPSAFDRFLVLNDWEELKEAVEKSRLGLSTVQARELLNGNLDLAEKSEKFMSKFEDDVFSGRGWNTVNDVVGGVPNVPAMLAGHPLSMRRRERATTHTGPLTMLLELTGSSGVAGMRTQRGAAMLALARLLSNVRPVEMYILVTLGSHSRMNMTALRVQTAPLDLSHAAALLCGDAAFQGLLNISMTLVGGGSWSYGDERMERRWSGEALRRVICPSAEMLFIPAAFFGDSFRDPEKWVRDMLRKYGMNAATQEEEN